MAVERTTPYIWVTWLTKLLVGENSCEWAAWFRAHHETWSYDKVPSTFDATAWQLNHTSLLNRIRSRLEVQGQTVFTENQNSFHLRGNVATLGGKPDLITLDGTSASTTPRLASLALRTTSRSWPTCMQCHAPWGSTKG